MFAKEMKKLCSAWISLRRVIPVLVLVLSLSSCSKRTVAESHTMPDGALLEIVGVPGNEHLLVYSLEVRSASGELIYKEALPDIPYGYSGGFTFKPDSDGVSVRRDDTDLGYLTSYHVNQTK